MGDVLVMYTIYDHPADFPHNFVCRAWMVGGGKPEPVAGDFWLAPTLEMVRALIPSDKVRLARNPDDDPVIIETWI